MAIVQLPRTETRIAVLAVRCAVVVAAAYTGTAWADWRISASEPIASNTETTVSLRYEGQGSGPSGGSGTLWLAGAGSPDILLPETIPYVDSAASLPLFIRGEGTGEVHVYDDIRQSTSVLSITAVRPSASGKPAWIPRLRIDGGEGPSVVSVNQKATATLTLSAGAGAMPPSTHISVADHRGRVVASRFHNTFDLVAGLDAVQVPAAGQYAVSVKLLNDHLTSLPLAVMREPQAIPFGKTAADLLEPESPAPGVTTQTVVGVRVALEHISTTATIVGEDRLEVVALARQSKEIQKNKWPFVIAGADLISMPVLEQKDKGAALVRWQRRLGSSFAPVMVEWDTIQRSPGSFKWTSLNSALPIYRKAIVRPLLTVFGRSAWSNELPTATSATLNAWTRFTRELSEKHMDLIWGLQSWRHPEDSWPDPQDYGRLVEATLNGFQMPNNQKVATPPVIIGGLHQFNADYLEPLLTTETISRINGVSFDLFPVDKKQSPEKNRFAETLAQATDFLKKKDSDRLNLWITGTGWPNGPEGVTEKVQANYMLRSHVMALSQGVYKFYWNSLADKTALPWDADSTSRMGLLDDQLFPKASGIAYNLMTYMMSGVEPIDITRQGNVNIYKFNIPIQNNKWPGLLYVAWTESPGAQDIRLEMTHGGGVYALDYLGAEVQTRKVSEDSANSTQGSYIIPIGFEPVFIWDAGKPGQTQ